ncbi:uncharacterized protein [Antedon mediterranea]|uniref:uncharacterized protein n=1 Tax=Antedon mediterranea TaxID=105859 RepID=UPI003AF9C637
MNEILSTSSLRRKLFLPAGSTTSESSPSMNYIQSSQCESAVFPEKLLSLSPINSVKQRATAPGRETPNTPASAKSQFSSSPKSTPSSKKYHSLVSSDIDSPLISPIKMDLLENLSDNNRVWMHPIENTPCGKTKFYLPPPGISPIPCFSGNVSTLGSSGKGKENKFGSMPKKSNLKVANSGNLPRGAVAKLNLMTVLDRHAGCTTNKYLKEVNMQTPVSKLSKEVLMPEMLLPIEPVLDSNTEKREVSDKEHQDLQMASSATTGYENQRKLSQVDASMLDFDASPDTFDSDTNAAEEYLTSTMRKDYFSEVPKEKREECSFPVNSLSDNDVGCHLNAVQKYLTSTMRNDYFSEMAKCNENNEEFSFPVNSLTENDDGCFLGKESAVDMSFCPENEMDISQESLLLPESDHRLGTPVSECNNMPSLNSISGHNQPIDSGVNGMTNSGSIQDDCKMASERCDMEMSMIEGGYNANTPPASTLPV